MKSLLLADVNKIKDYLFASVRLRQIVNASALLTDVNERQTEALVHKHGGSLVCTGGGITQAVFEARDGETAEAVERRAEACAGELETLFVRETITATIATHVQPWDGRNETFVQALREGLHQVQQRKVGGEDQFAPSPGGSPFFRVCPQSGSEYATRRARRGDTDEDFGASSHRKQGWPRPEEAEALQSQWRFKAEANDRLPVDVILREKFAEELRKDEALHERYPGLSGVQSSHFAFSDDLGDIVSAARPRNYLGFIDADGNGLGECLNRLGEKEVGPEAYRVFSKLLSQTTRDALVDAAVAVLKEPVAELWQRRRDGQPCLLSLRVLILGGDDVLVITLPQYAVSLAHEFCRRFQHLSEERLKDPGQFANQAFCGLPEPQRPKLNDPEKEALKSLRELTMSAGVVIAHQKFPFLSFERLGGRLQKSAKARAWAVNRRPLTDPKHHSDQPLYGAVDFQVVTASGVDTLEALRTEAYTLRQDPEVRLTSRPYLVHREPGRDELGCFLDAVKGLRQADVTPSQLKALHGLLRNGYHDGHVLFMKWFLRLREDQAKAAIRQVLAAGQTPPEAVLPSPWARDNRPGGNGQLHTPLLDAVELFDLLLPVSGGISE